MGWIVSVIIATVLLILVAFDARLCARNPQWFTGGYEKDYPTVKKWALAAVATMVVIWGVWVGIHTVVNSIHQVPAGHDGVVREFGAIIDQTEDGLQLIPPWRGIENADTRVQTWMFTDDEERVEEVEGAKRAGDVLSSFSKETQDVFIDATLNIEVSPEDIQELYRNVGSDYFGKLVPARVRQMFKNETVEFKAVEIAPNREKIRAAVEEELRRELGKFSIEVVGLLIDEIDFNDPFKDAIESKQVATQNAQEAEQRVLEAEFKAQQRVKTAEGQATANGLLAASLTPQVIQYEALQTVRANIEVMFGKDSPVTIALLPSDQGFIIDPGQLLSSLSTTEAPTTPAPTPEEEEEEEEPR